LFLRDTDPQLALSMFALVETALQSGQKINHNYRRLSPQKNKRIALFFWINNGFSSPAMDGIMSLFTIAGDASVWIGFGILFIIMQDKKNASRMILTFLISMIVAAGVIHSIKYVGQRDRPLERFKHKIATDEVMVHAPLNKLKSRSFPSGHALVLAALAGASWKFSKELSIILAVLWHLKCECVIQPALSS